MAPDAAEDAVVLAAVKDASAPLKRWPEDGPSLTAAARDGAGMAQVGAEGWRRSNKRMRCEALSILFDFPIPLPAPCRVTREAEPAPPLFQGVVRE